MNAAPIVVFAYNRPKHLALTLEALSLSPLAAQSEVYIYCDGPQGELTSQMQEVRDVARSASWARSLEVVEREENHGLAKSITTGVSEVVSLKGRVIVLEDDIVTAPGFLPYMNKALEVYQEDPKVMEVSGFMYPIKWEGLPESFFYPANSCWGWGTWKDSWDLYNDDSLELYLKLIERGAEWEHFNAFQGSAFKDQLLANLEGRVKTWAVKWHATMHLHDATALHPRQSLTRNIGLDGSGENCGLDDYLDSMHLADTIDVFEIAEHDMRDDVALAIRRYFEWRQNPPATWRSVLREVKKVIAGSRPAKS